MFAGDKGLREHRQVKHGNSYEDSKSAVAESRMALAQLSAGAFASSRSGSSRSDRAFALFFASASARRFSRLFAKPRRARPGTRSGARR